MCGLRLSRAATGHERRILPQPSAGDSRVPPLARGDGQGVLAGRVLVRLRAQLLERSATTCLIASVPRPACGQIGFLCDVLRPADEDEGVIHDRPVLEGQLTAPDESQEGLTHAAGLGDRIGDLEPRTLRCSRVRCQKLDGRRSNLSRERNVATFRSSLTSGPPAPVR